MHKTNIGRIVRFQRTALGLSQHAAAEKVGMSFWRFGRIERGIQHPNTDELAALARALRVGGTVDPDAMHVEIAHAD